MNHVIGDVLPYAIAITISPVPIIAVILMLMSPRPRPLGLSFLTGWVAGIAISVVVFTLLAGFIPHDAQDGPQPIVGIIQLALGAMLVLLAIRQWKARPAPGEVPPLPKWMSAIDSMKPGGALVLAFALAAINPKNMMMSVAAATTISSASMGLATTTVAIVVFVVLAVLSVLVPVVSYLVAPAKATHMLEAMRTWLTVNNGTIMAVLFVILGVQLLGKGIGSF